jgi:RNA polymerase sigma factor (sigma-70 family)
MTHSKLTPGIPAPWLKYIKSHAGRYATGMFSRDDAVQVAAVAFLTAQARFKPGKGVFDHYVKAAIRNALLNARKTEQKHWDLREDTDDDVKASDDVPHWAGEEIILEALEEASRSQRVLHWADALPLKFAPLWDALYARDMSQREFAAEIGVSQARISQRNGQFVARARADLDMLVSTESPY